MSLICSLSGKGGVKVTLVVADTELDMEVDTGATVTVIPHEIYTQRLSHVPLKSSKVKLQSYNGERLRVIGEAMVSVKYGQQECNEKLIVVDVGDKPAVMERNWLTHIRLDWASLFKVESAKPMNPSEEFPDLFADGMGTLKGYEAKITLSAEAQPRFHRPRAVPYALQEKVEKELERLQQERVLQPVESSEWAAPIVVVRKGDGSVRICGDYKVTINPFLELNAYPMPNPQDLFATLAGGKFFSRLDMKQAYQQMRIHPESQKFLTVNTSKGLFVYTRMPFGISSAPAIWQRAMDGILVGIPGVTCYLDDILVVGSSEEEHDERLRQVLTRLDQVGVRLKKEKCEFKKTQVEYLGHVVDAQGLRPAEKKLSAIKDAPEPANVSELKAFLGLLNYYNRFLPCPVTGIAYVPKLRL